MTTTRKLGSMLANTETKLWKAGGWVVEDNTRWVYTRQGPRKITVSDYFHRYDRIMVWPARGVTVYLQVSAKNPGSSHPIGPLGFAPPPGSWVPDDLVDAPNRGQLLALPANRGKLWGLPAGSYEVYVWYRKLKTRGGRWTAERRWWVRTISAAAQVKEFEAKLIAGMPPS